MGGAVYSFNLMLSSIRFICVLCYDFKAVSVDLVFDAVNGRSLRSSEHGAVLIHKLLDIYCCRSISPSEMHTKLSCAALPSCPFRIVAISQDLHSAYSEDRVFFFRAVVRTSIMRKQYMNMFEYNRVIWRGLENIRINSIWNIGSEFDLLCYLNEGIFECQRSSSTALSCILNSCLKSRARVQKQGKPEREGADNQCCPRELEIANGVSRLGNNFT